MKHPRAATWLVQLVLTALAGATGHPAVAATTPEADYTARCNASGVLSCQGFDDSSVFAYTSSQTQGLYPAYGTNYFGGVQDTSIKVSGNSSLRFNIVGLTPADVAGNFQWNFGKNFSQNSTFYVQFQARFDDVFVNTNWDSTAQTSPKLVDFYDGNGMPCANIELTTVEYYGGGIPTMYSECGARSLTSSPSNITSWQTTATVPYLMQQGSSSSAGYNCLYGQLNVGTGNGTGCFKYLANTWITFYYKVTVGSWGSPNSSVQAWISTNGGPYVEWINVTNYTLSNDGSSSGGFNRLMLTPYMTGKSSSVNYATAHMWIDELIVSGQPIAAPGGLSTQVAAIPLPPSGVSVQ
jgi:hypothetical protein